MAMASSSAPTSSSSSSDVLCAACRAPLPGVAAPGDAAPALWPVAEDPRTGELPPWVGSRIEELGWTKGKLVCPGCGARVGGFDFVGCSSSASPIYLVASRVDVRRRLDVDALVKESRERNSVVDIPTVAVGTTSPLEAALRATASSLTNNEASPSSSASSTPSKSSASASATSATNNSSANEVDAAASPLPSTPGTSSPSSALSSLDEDALSSLSSSSSSSSSSPSSSSPSSGPDSPAASTSSPGLPTRRQKDRARLLRRRLERQRRERERKKREARREELVEKVLYGEPELDAVEDNHVCAVCLDLLHEPYNTKPCNHLFCEPCLRRLGSKNPMNTLCPMCRTRISFCEKDKALSGLILEKYPTLHARRKKFERSTHVYRMALPWRPGWRNLLSGRPLGGNRFPDATAGALLRRICRQVPYYVPPVVIANLVNLLLLAFLLGAVEVVPLFLRAILQRRTNIRNAAAAAASSSSSSSSSSASPSSSTFAEQNPDFARSFVLGNPPGGVAMGRNSKDGLCAFASQSERFMRLIGDIFKSSRGGLVTPANLTEHLCPSAAAFRSGWVRPGIVRPESAGPALDATFYYVCCFLVVAVAVFGNFILLHHHRRHFLLGGPSPLDRLYNFFGPRGGRLHMVVYLCTIGMVNCGPLLLLPLMVPLPVPANVETLEWMSHHPPPPSHWLAESLVSAAEAAKSYLSLAVLVVVGALYWAGSITLEYEVEEDLNDNEGEDNENNLVVVAAAD